ncbi:Vam6/Vps39-like protein [Clonorchis sinensis]|uniref:Vam6/Vps39-like protein n=2 Tax=Clonorchis sinensis TaxID=79923 RepID=H2KQ08_CLOSI|nr:Vam6/Vps39-like protein [Clonorchis sinensis]
MHEAFFPICLLRDYPYALECLTCYDNFLIVGTKQGLLLVYEVTPKSLNHPVYFIPPITYRDGPRKSIRLKLDDLSPTSDSTTAQCSDVSSVPQPSFSTRVYTTRTFGRKPILQLTALPDLDLLLALADGQMNVYQLQNYQLVTIVPMSKGASLFAYFTAPAKGKQESNSTKGTVSSGSDYIAACLATSMNLRICVAVKRRLMLWRWDPLGQNFVPPGGSADTITPDWLSEVTVSDTARVLQFYESTHIILGTRAEYLQISLTTGAIRSISNPGRNQLPLISFLPACFHTPTPDVQVHQFVIGERQHSTDGQADALSLASTTSAVAAEHNSSPSSNAASLTFSDAPLGLGKDDVLDVVSSTLERRSMTKIRWTGAPRHLHVYPPYIIAAMEQFLEVRVADPCELVQQMPIARVQAFCHQGGWLYVATAPAYASLNESTRSNPSPQRSSPTIPETPGKSPRPKTTESGNEVWVILPANRTALVERLVKVKEFDLALLLAKEAPWMGQNPIETRPIAILQAYYLYQQQEFARALQIFTQQLVDPSHVLGLFPDLLSDEMQSERHYPVGHVPLDRAQFSNAAEPVITYLLTWRRLVHQALSYNRRRIFSTSSILARDFHMSANSNELVDVTIRCYPIVDGSPTITSALALLGVIDTCLLKCYLATNTARVAPLLRQANSCNLEESEKTLLEHHRYQDLVMLYQAHGLHRKALAVLQQLGLLRLKRSARKLTPSTFEHDAEGVVCVDASKIFSTELEQLGNPRHMVNYFQNLGPTSFDLVAEFAGWIMHNYPVAWMRIFTSWERQLHVERLSAMTPTQMTGREKKSSVSAVPSLAYRGQVVKYLESQAIHLMIPFLEHLIFMRLDSDVDSDEDEDEEINGLNTDGTLDSEEYPGPSDDATISERGVLETSAEQISRIDDHSLKDSIQFHGAPLSYAVRNSLWPLPGSKRISAVSSDFSDPDLLPPIVRHSEEADPTELHTRYAAALMARVRAIQSVGKPFTFRVNDEKPKSGPVARLRRRLLRFLTHPNASYSSRKLLDKCPYDALFEERTVLLANLNYHEQALTLLIHVLDDWDRAISHCANVYQRVSHTMLEEKLPTSSHLDFNDKRASSVQPATGLPVTTLSRSPAHDSLGPNLELCGSPAAVSHQLGDGSITNVELEPGGQEERDIFFLLVQICIQPSEPASLGIVIPELPDETSVVSEGFSPKPEKAIEVLRRFGDRVDAAKVVRILTNTRLFDVAHFLKSTFINQESRHTHLVFLNNAAKAELSASRHSLVRATRQHFLVSASSRCRTCRRRIGNSAFARCPNTGELEHYGCCRDVLGMR